MSEDVSGQNKHESEMFKRDPLLKSTMPLVKSTKHKIT